MRYQGKMKRLRGNLNAHKPGESSYRCLTDVYHRKLNAVIDDNFPRISNKCPGSSEHGYDWKTTEIQYW